MATLCNGCGRVGAKVRRVTRSHGQRKRFFVIENVPIVSFPYCGKRYIRAQTMHEIERIKLHRRSLAVDRPVAVAEFR